jgi:ATP-dependent exoDNAse (exonuclease V) alpha subunit
MQLSSDQQLAFEKIKKFISNDSHNVFLLKGYAGTGKTTLIRFLLEWLRQEKIPYRLMATTGRAANVLKNKTGYDATTVHSEIYYFDKVEGKSSSDSPDIFADPHGQLFLNFDVRLGCADDDLIYIVDEASMMSNEASVENSTARFGSGSLLADFMKYAKGNKIIFVGDPCQLPPVSNELYSPALDKDFLTQNFNVKVDEIELTEIKRQAQNSEILSLAAPFRKDIINNRYEQWFKIKDPVGTQVSLVDSVQHMIRQFTDIYHENGPEHAIILCNSNNQCNQLNFNIRNILFPNKTKLQVGDLLIVVQNSYTTRLCNGDQVIVESIDETEKRFNFYFTHVQVRSLFNNNLYDTLILENLLYNNQSNLMPDEVKSLMIDFTQRMKNIGIKFNTEEYKNAMLSDPYLNALRAKFGYALTVHKAQGGEWPHVFINISKGIYYLDRPYVYRWLYTAMTRASEHLYIVDGSWIQSYNRRQGMRKFNNWNRFK